MLSIPMTQADPARDIASPEERAARNSLYNSPAAFQSSARDLTATPQSDNQQHTHIFVDRRPVPRIPSRLSDLIAIGTVTAFQPYLSQDRTSIYSELQFTPEQILKDNGGGREHPIIILQGGGTLRFPDGRTESAGPAEGSSPIDAGKRYLLFLGFSPSTHAYSIVKAWDLSDQVPAELAPNGRPVKRKYPTDSYDVSSQDNLIAAVRAEIYK